MMETLETNPSIYRQMTFQQVCQQKSQDHRTVSLINGVEKTGGHMQGESKGIPLFTYKIPTHEDKRLKPMNSRR